MTQDHQFAAVIPMAATAKRILELHAGLAATLRRSLTDAIEIGRLLVKVQEELEYGEWEQWRASHIAALSERSCRDYLRLYRNREEIESAQGVNDALRMLSEQSKRLAEFETIQRELHVLDGEGKALVRIRNLKLFRDEFSSFDEFVESAARDLTQLPYELAYDHLQLLMETAENDAVIKKWEERDAAYRRESEVKGKVRSEMNVASSIPA